MGTSAAAASGPSCESWWHPGAGDSNQSVAEPGGLQGCSVYFPRPQGWNPGGGGKSLYGLM